MNDPHVNALIYRMIGDRNSEYDEAQPLDHETDKFSIKIENKRVVFVMLEHFETVDAAQAVVEPFIKDWQDYVCLQDGPGLLELAYIQADVIDRQPTPGVANISGSASVAIAGQNLKAVVSSKRANYPTPPGAFRTSNKLRDMLDKYYKLKDDESEISHLANYSLNSLRTWAVEGDWDQLGESNRSRKADKQLRSKINVTAKAIRRYRNFANSRGDHSQHRKGFSYNRITNEERAWVSRATKVFIERRGQVDAGSVPSESLDVGDI